MLEKYDALVRVRSRVQSSLAAPFFQAFLTFAPSPHVPFRAERCANQRHNAHKSDTGDVRQTFSEGSKMTGWVYLIGYEDATPLDPVKIGYAKDPWARLSSLQTGSHRNLTLLDKVPGTIEAEKALHATLADHRVAREWFSCSEEIAHAFDSIREAILDRAEVLRPQNSELSLDDWASLVPCDTAMFQAEMGFTLEYYSYGRETDDWNMDDDHPEAKRLLEAADIMRGKPLDYFFGESDVSARVGS